MRIFFDCRYVRSDHHDGISRFSSRLVEQVASLAHVRGDEVIMLISNQSQLSMLPALPFELISSPTSVLEPLVALKVNKFNPDIVFSPMQTMGSIGRRYKLVLTVHDLIYYSHPTPPRDFSWPIRLLWRFYHTAWWPQKFLLSRSDAVIAVSETTKNLIAEKNLVNRSVYVVHNAADPIVLAAETASSPRQRIILYMGSFMPYKNVETLVRTAALLPDFSLHLLSRISSADKNRLANLTSAQLVFHDGISDEQYVELIGRATALVTASRDEGFGIPLVEAMSLGLPIVVSDIPIFHEIGGDAALFAPSDDPEAFATQLRELLDVRTWNSRSQACIEQASKFNWKKSAEELLNVLVKVSGS
jgi:glycosyltransferase involved in cell wall biosynthesis